jgi:hypothetical protein
MDDIIVWDRPRAYVLDSIFWMDQKAVLSCGGELREFGLIGARPCVPDQTF